MDIFESLENLGVSEECFDEIMSTVKELLNEKLHYFPGVTYSTSNDKIDAAEKSLPKRLEKYKELKDKYVPSSLSSETKQKVVQKVPSLKRAANRVLDALHKSKQPKLSKEKDKQQKEHSIFNNHMKVFRDYKVVE